MDNAEKVKVEKKPTPKPVKKSIETLQKENEQLRKILSAYIWGDLIIGVIIASLLLIFSKV